MIGSSIPTSLSDSPDQTTSGSLSWLATGPVSKSHENLIQSVSSYPAMGIVKTETGSTACQIIQNRTTKATAPPHSVPFFKNANFSVLRAQGTEFHNYPSGAMLFKDYPSLSQKFDALIEMLIKQPKFIAFVRKIHLNTLNETYRILMNIYTNFNLQHVGIKQTKNAQGNPALHINIPAFLQEEDEYASNKKTLIINHFVNVIESQLNGAIRSVMPKVPHTYATYSGKTLIQNDYSIDLTHFIIQQLDPALIKYKNDYLQALVTYLAFFQEYTSLLLEPHPQKQQHFTAFLDVAETINHYLYSDLDVTQEQTQEAKMKHVLQKMDPPMFTFSYDDIRAVKLIPHLAKSLPKNTKQIKWPEHIVDAANEIITVDGHPMAYFKDDAGNIVKSNQATKLFIVIQSGKNLFEEELLAQPEWLNSWTGVVKVLRGCFGDFSSLLGLNILDPCMEALIQNALGVMQGKDVNKQNPLANICQTYLNSFKKEPVQVPEAKKEAMQDLSSILPSTTTRTKSQPSLQLKPTSKSIIKLSPSTDDISTLSPSANDISSALLQ